VQKTTRKIKIAFFIDQLATGGTERQLKMLAEGLDRNRFEVGLYLLRGEADHPMKPDNVDCHLLGINSIGSITGFKKIIKAAAMLKKQRVDIVQTFFQDAAFCGALAARMAGVRRLLISVRDLLFWADSGSVWPLRFAFFLSKGVVVNSRAVQEKVLPLTGRKPLSVIPNGIETGEKYSRSNESKKRLADEFGFTANKPVIVMVSNCNRPVKRVDLLVESAPLVLKEHNAVFIVVGDGYLRTGLEKRAAELGVGHKIIFVGHRSDIAAILAGSDIFVNTSDSEGLSNSIMEAMRAELPVVVSDVEGNRQLVTPDISGCFFKAGDFQQLSRKLVYLIENQETGRQMGARGKEAVASNFGEEMMVQKFEELYRSLVK